VHSGYAFFGRAMGAAKERTVSFDAVADDHALAMLASRGQGVNRALKGIEGVRFTLFDYLE